MGKTVAIREKCRSSTLTYRPMDVEDYAFCPMHPPEGGWKTAEALIRKEGTSTTDIHPRD